MSNTSSNASHAADQPSDTDSLQRSIVINAPRERVWRALSNAEEFGAWFGADLSGQTFVPGQRNRGLFNLPGCENLYFDAVIEHIQPPDEMSMHWHPYSIDTSVDYSGEIPTLVSFSLKDAPGNATLLTVVESGFDKVPAHRRRKAFEMNSNGWEKQLQNIARYASN
ncbi:SRPBCC family protein [Undibacterium sp. TJN19]|uniref:SRPBCC family protein n=1 Tax=Undibacterium sp. TJN19 TaxID=3413055 RepID=UPI003BF150BE